jgi:hypothetical protein
VLTTPHRKTLIVFRKGYMSHGFGLVVGSCERGNETSGSIKCEEFLDYRGSLAQEGLCSMELVRKTVLVY